MLAPMLVMSDPTKKYKIECDASDYAIGTILSQLEENRLWQPIAFFSKSMLDAERNYGIYNKQLLAIIKALKEWRHYIQKLPHPVEIWTDYKNLKYFMSSQNLTRH